jgi:uncharacterized protein (TIGR00288 family)
MASKVCVFIDVGNQFYCINKKWPGRKLNYEKYLETANTFGSVTRAFAYGTQVEGAAINFITCLHHLGYEPHYKTVEKNSWYSWDVGMAVDIVRLILHDKTDVIIVGNSNRSMAPALQWAKERGVRVVVVGCGINKDLKDVCDQWIEISDKMLADEDEPQEAKDEVAEATQ